MDMGSGGSAETAFADEAALISSLRSGDAAAYDHLVRSYCGRMIAVARRFLANEDDAHDAVQDAFTSAFRSMAQFEGGSSLGTWLHRIVVNAALMKLRSRARKPERSIEELLPRFLADGHQAFPATPWQEDLIDALDRVEIRNLVRDTINQLPETYRTVLLLRDIEEYDTRQTADLLGLSENAVKTRLHRARQALRTLLDHHFRRET